MSRLPFIMSAILAVRAAAQPSHAAEGFAYVGCVEADASSFPLVIDFFAPFTPEQCQGACAGSATYAALGGGCLCDAPGLGNVDFTVVDESKCSNLCIPDEEDKGFCGGSGVYNLYKKDGTDGGDDCDYDDEDEEDDEDCESTTSQGGHHTKTQTEDKDYESASHDGDGHGGHHTKTKTETIVTITSCPPDVPDCPARPTYTKPANCDGSCPDKITTVVVPTMTSTVCPGGCDTSGVEDEDKSPNPASSRTPVVTAAAGQNVPAMGAVALGALFLGVM